MPSLMLKPMAKSVRSEGVDIMTTWGRPLKARATGTSAAIAASRGTTAPPWRRKQVVISDRRRTLRCCVDAGVETSLGCIGGLCLSGHRADENRDGFGRRRLTLAVVMRERQQRVGLRIVGCDASALELMRQRGEAADPSLQAIAVEGFDFDEPLGGDTTRGHVVLVHEDDAPGAVDASITVIHAVNCRVVLVVTAHGREAKHLRVRDARIFVDPPE